MEPDKRANILYAAGQVFARRGFKKAPIDEIARVAGVAKGTIYLAVSSKEELYERAVALALEVWLAANHLPASAETDLGPLLGALLTDEVASAADHPLVAALLTGQVAAALPGWEDPIEALRRRARANVLELLRRGARSGRLRRDLDLEEVAVLLQDLEAATLLFHSRGEALEDAHFHRWDTAVSALVEGLDAARDAESAF
ncbi:MAG: hypothetical protein CVU56_10205 [Deltaproteobacteria bacterium HGW-Deltaproteobacteria-14]|jgi:TetR/AcrR family fatty acid metabolism transcriptional regulator|nr:MAG: hypothetical protein CVU56_10205 [Deltaproteobacteria bacterium HGW-Deltaproteobacteria-14]